MIARGLVRNAGAAGENIKTGLAHGLELEGPGLRAAVVAALLVGMLALFAALPFAGEHAGRYGIMGLALGFALVAGLPLLACIQGTMKIGRVDLRPLLRMTLGMRVAYALILGEALFAPFAVSHAGRLMLRQAGLPFGSDEQVSAAAMLGLALGWFILVQIKRCGGLPRIAVPRAGVARPTAEQYENAYLRRELARRTDTTGNRERPASLDDMEQGARAAEIAPDALLEDAKPLEVPDLDPTKPLRMPDF